jgi:antitoxin (DNA-binding transcriptional repressor) of toxin-antitoxin stability system
MSREISIRELRTGTDAVVAAIRAGERLTLTVDGEPVADIVPHAERRSPWMPAAELRRIRREMLADVFAYGPSRGSRRPRRSVTQTCVRDF